MDKLRKKISLGMSDDYAVMVVGDTQFYYGHETVDPETEEWCFTVKIKGVEVFRLTYTEISNIGRIDDIQSCLIAGIGAYLLNERTVI